MEARRVMRGFRLAHDRALSLAGRCCAEGGEAALSLEQGGVGRFLSFCVC